MRQNAAINIVVIEQNKQKQWLYTYLIGVVMFQKLVVVFLFTYIDTANLQNLVIYIILLTHFSLQT